jgi:hypothetical protein
VARSRLFFATRRCGFGPGKGNWLPRPSPSPIIRRFLPRHWSASAAGISSQRAVVHVTGSSIAHLLRTTTTKVGINSPKVSYFGKVKRGSE